MIVRIILAVCVLDTVNETEPSAVILGGEHLGVGGDGVVAEIAEPCGKYCSYVIVADVADHEITAGKRILRGGSEEFPALGFKRGNTRILREIRLEKNVFGFACFLCNDVNRLALAAAGSGELGYALCGGLEAGDGGAGCIFPGYTRGGLAIAVKDDRIARKCDGFSNVRRDCGRGVGYFCCRGDRRYGEYREHREQHSQS